MEAFIDGLLFFFDGLRGVGDPAALAGSPWAIVWLAGFYSPAAVLAPLLTWALGKLD